VGVIDASTKMVVTGWINSIALIGQLLKELEVKKEFTEAVILI